MIYVTNNLYHFHWKSGQVEEGRGTDPANALTALGYSQGAIPALDYWELIKEPTNETTK